jgi:hypothetical protein
MLAWLVGAMLVGWSASPAAPPILKVRTGMTRAEVERALGEQPRFMSPAGADLRVYHAWYLAAGMHVDYRDDRVRSAFSTAPKKP